MAVSEAECERLGAGEEESEDGPPPPRPRPPPPPPASARSPAATARAGVAPRAVRANMHKTGTRVHLLPCPGDAPPSTRRYILCSGCATAYVGNAVTAPTEVRCPQCKQSFSTSPAALFVAVDPLVVAADAKIASQARARREAGPNEIVCKHFGACPGCTLQSDVSRPMVAREADAFARNALGALQPLSVEMGPSTGWRTHAKLAIRPAGTGLFKTRSHDVVEIPDCAVHHPAINAAAAALQKAIKACGVRPYDEVRMMGRARYALFTVERQSGRVQVTVVWNAASWKEANPVAPRLGAEYWANNRDLLHSVWFNWNTSSGNAITSQKDDAFYLMHGPALIGELVAGARVYFAPTVFRQANLDAFEALIIPRLLSYIPKGSALVELYGGVGVISLAALRRQADLQLRSVTVAEINQFAAAPFRRSLAQFDRAVRERVTYVVGSDDDTVGRAVGEDADVVIVDPPRVGVSEVCMSELAAPPPGSPLRRLIYVSCGFEAFKRDSRRLVSGGWSVRALHGYVLFPGSNHIEMLAVFDRRPR
jgi:23S rRNA (uracil1939-C5)-methyltransferase